MFPQFCILEVTKQFKFIGNYSQTGLTDITCINVKMAIYTNQYFQNAVTRCQVTVFLVFKKKKFNNISFYGKYACHYLSGLHSSL